MKVYSNVLQVLDKIKNYEDERCIIEHESTINEYLSLYLICEYDPKISKNGDEQKKIGNIAFNTILIILEKNFKLQGIISLLRYCHADIRNFKKFIHLKYGQNQKVLSQFDSMVESYGPIENTTLKIEIASPKYIEELIVSGGILYGVAGVKKLLDYFFDEQMNGKNKNQLLGKIVLGFACHKDFDKQIEEGMHVKVVKFLLSNGAHTKIVLGKIGVQGATKKYTLLEVLQLKDCSAEFSGLIKDKIIITNEILLENLGLFSDQILSKKIGTIKVSENFCDLVRELFVLGYFQSIDVLLKNNPNEIMKIENAGEERLVINKFRFKINLLEGIFFGFELDDDQKILSLLELYFKYNIIRKEKITPLIYLFCCKMKHKGKMKLLEFLFEKGFDIFTKDIYGKVSFVQILDSSLTSINIIDFIVASKILNKRYKNIFQTLYQVAFEQELFNLMLYLRVNYDSQLPSPNRNELTIFLFKYLVENSNAAFTVLLKGCQKISMNVDYRVNHELEAVDCSLSVDSRFFKFLENKTIFSMSKKPYVLTPLCFSVMKNDVQAYQQFRSVGAVINLVFSDQLHPLQLAALFDADELAFLMLQDSTLKIENPITKKIEENLLNSIVNIFLSKRKYNFISLLLNHVNFNNVYFDEQNFLFLLDSNFDDFLVIKKIWSDRYLLSSSLYYVLWKRSDQESFLLSMLGFIGERILQNLEILEKNPLIHKDFAQCLNLCLNQLTCIQLKSSGFSTVRCQELFGVEKDKQTNSTVMTMYFDQNGKVVLPNAKFSDYYSIVKLFLSITSSCKINFADFPENTRHTFFELLCLGNFSSLMCEMIANPKILSCIRNLQKISMLHYAATFNKSDFLVILLQQFKFDKNELLEVILITLRQNQYESFDLILATFITSVGFNQAAKELRKISPFICVNQERFHDLIVNYIGPDHARELQKKDKLIQLEPSAKENLPQIQPKSGQTLYKFFNIFGRPSYVFIPDKFYYLFEKLDDVFSKNNVNLRIINHNIVYVAHNQKCGGADYKIKIWGDDSKKRFLLFRHTEDAVSLREKEANTPDDVVVYYAKLLGKH